MDQNPAAYLLSPPVDKLRMKAQRARLSKEHHRDGARAARAGKRKTESSVPKPKAKAAKGAATVSDGSLSFGSDRSSGALPIWFLPACYLFDSCCFRGTGGLPFVRDRNSCPHLSELHCKVRRLHQQNDSRGDDDDDDDDDTRKRSAPKKE